MHAEMTIAPAGRLIYLKFADQCCYFVNERKYAEAYGFMKNLYALGPQTYFVLVLAKYYITLLATEQTKKADQIRDQMAEFLQKSCTDTAKDLCDYATELRFCDEFIESVLFYQIAFAKFQNEENVENLLELPAQVSMGILLNSFELFKDRLISKTMICSYFIPIFQKIARTVESKFSFDKKLSSAAQAQCYFHAALSQELTCEFVDQEMTCIKGLALLKRHHSKASAMKMSLYSCLLELLGLVNVKLGRHDDGVQLLVQAVAAKKKTKDLKNPEEKAEDLNRVQKTLKVLQKRSSRRK